MKIVELLNNIQIPLSNEEADVLAKFSSSTQILKSELSQREQLIANTLVEKNVLHRKKSDGGKLAYSKKIR